jgi:hypothetical protein
VEEHLEGRDEGRGGVGDLTLPFPWRTCPYLQEDEDRGHEEGLEEVVEESRRAPLKEPVPQELRQPAPNLYRPHTYTTKTPSSATGSSDDTQKLAAARGQAVAPR